MRITKLFFLVVAILGCSSRSRAPGPPPPPPVDAGQADVVEMAFQAEPPAVYVAKVKNILVGLPPTDEELAAVIADPTKLGALVDGWMALPPYKEKLKRFFALAFQQTQITSNDFTDQVYAQVGLNPSTTPLVLQNAQESFARTMVELTSQGKPLTEAMTTRQLMMTTAMKELYAFLDTWQIDNEGGITDDFRTQNRFVPITVQAGQGPIPIAESLDPNSPNYMVWYDPDVLTEETIPECQQDPVHLAPKARSLHYVLLGSVDGRKLSDGTFCPGFDGTAKGAQFLPSDFTDWTMVTVREPKAGEKTTLFYDLPALRAAKELVLSVPRVGYFTTPAFFANWQTNASNQMRVTTHQTLIVATGSVIDATDPTLPAGTPGLNAVHNNQGACFGCHKVLDPTRSIFSATYSWNYHHQIDSIWTAQPGVFAFRGVVKPVKSMAELGETLAKHPLVAPAWTQKLCHYVNSAPCDEEDPEFKRIVALFESTNHSWSTLVKALVTSPLVTHAATTQTARRIGQVVAVSRRDHLCAALNARLGFTDVCGLDAQNAKAQGSNIQKIVSGLPSDGYARGAVAPVLPNQPTLFFQAGVENICESVAAEVIDAAGAPGIKQWSSQAPEAAITEFVALVMALPPSDGRASKARELLAAHFAAAMQQPNTTATQALRSTFVVACLAPSAISVGL